MAKQQPRSRQARRAMQDKSVLDHLTSGPRKPDMNKRQGAAHDYGTNEGRKLEKAIRKEWTAEKGGPPDF